MASRVLLLVLSFAFAFGVAELAVRLNLLPDPEFVVSEGWWLERFARKRSGGNPRKFATLDSELGWVVAPDLDELEYQDVRISTNSAHMRGKQEFAIEPGDAPRIVAIGDSYTFGQCAEDSQTWPAVLSRRIPGSEVLNLGVMGYGQGQALLRLERDGLPYSPDVVVFGFHGTDMRRSELHFRDYAKPHFELTEAGLEVEGQPVPEADAFVDRWWPPRLWNYVEMYRDGERWQTREFQDELRELSAAIVDEMAQKTRDAGAELVVVFLPQPGHLRKDGPYGWSWMEELCASAEAEGRYRCANPVPRFREIAPNKRAANKHFRCHYSPALYRAVGAAAAEAVAPLLETRTP